MAKKSQKSPTGEIIQPEPNQLPVTSYQLPSDQPENPVTGHWSLATDTVGELNKREKKGKLFANYIREQ